MKDIKDCLHLYTGCSIYDLFENKTGMLLSVAAQGEQPVVIIHKTIHGREFNEVKPILRPLSSMTEEEALEVCKKASPIAWGDYRFHKWVATLDPKSDKTWKAYNVKNKKSNYSFIVDLVDGDITLFDDDDYELVYINQNYRFWYLKKHFDIFGLIEAGLAIDETTLVTK